MASVRPKNPLAGTQDRVTFRLLCRRCVDDMAVELSSHTLELRGLLVTALVGSDGPMDGMVAGFEVVGPQADAEHAVHLLQEMVFNWCDRVKEPVAISAWNTSQTGFFESAKGPLEPPPPVPPQGAHKGKHPG